MVGLTDVSAADRWSRQVCRADRWSAIARSAQGFMVAVKSSRPTVGSTGVRAADRRSALPVFTQPTNGRHHRCLRSRPLVGCRDVEPTVGRLSRAARGVERCGEEQPTNGRLYRCSRSRPTVGSTGVRAANQWSALPVFAQPTNGRHHRRSRSRPLVRCRDVEPTVGRLSRAARGVDRCREEQPTNGRLYQCSRSGPTVGITGVCAANQWSALPMFPQPTVGRLQGCRADRWSAIARSARG
jgi:hypothetical protein